MVSETVLGEIVALRMPDSTEGQPWVVLSGNPFEGLAIYGTFPTEGDALEFGEQEFDHDQWWPEQLRKKGIILKACPVCGSLEFCDCPINPTELKELLGEVEE